MEPGNDPGRDEYGLPPVDIEIPDDARDLDRDVQAYYRELRVRRRHIRIRRLTSPLTRHGMVLPLVAACLALTLLTGSLLTVLSGRQVPLLRSRLSPGPTQRVSASRGQQLPNAYVFMNDKQVELRGLALPAVLAWVPSGCYGCAALLSQLARRAANAGVNIYFVANDRAPQDRYTLTKQVPPRYSQLVVNDTTNALGVFQPKGVTAILAHSDGSVAAPDVVRRLSTSSGLNTFEARLKLLARASTGGEAGASGPAQPAPQAS